MKKYNVTITLLYKVKTSVTADSPAEAERIASEISLRELEEMSYEQGITEIIGYESDTIPNENN